MAYTKQTWTDLPSKTTPINASRLNHIEDGIYAAANVADTANSGLTSKVDKVEGKGLSENDFTDTLKTKLDNIAAGAEVNVQSDWNQSDNTADDYIKNKPNVVTKDTIAPTEADATSSSAEYAVDEQFYLSDGNLYTATSTISQGSAIVVYPTAGYNCKPSDSVTGQITTGFTEVNSDIADIHYNEMLA